MLVGTNNYDNTVDEVTEGLLAIAQAIRDKQPTANLIVMVGNFVLLLFFFFSSCPDRLISCFVLVYNTAAYLCVLTY